MEQTLPLVPNSQIDFKNESVSSTLPKNVHEESKWQVVNPQGQNMEPNLGNQYQIKPAAISLLSSPVLIKDSHDHQYSIGRPQTSFKITEQTGSQIFLLDQKQIEKDLDIPPRRSSISSTISGKNEQGSFAFCQSSSAINPSSTIQTIQKAAIKTSKEPSQLAYISTNLPVKPGNTINQFWKSMYMGQFDETSNQQSMNESLSQKNNVENAFDFNPPSSSTLKKKKQDSSLVKSSNNNAEGSRLARHDTIESIASYLTAPSYLEKESLNKQEETVDDFHSISSHSTTRSSMVQGSRPAPWKDSASNLDTSSDSLSLKHGETFHFNIEKDAKTSTTTKAFKGLMRQASQSSNASTQDPASSSNLSNFTKKIQNYWHSDPNSLIVDDPMKSYLSHSQPILIREISKIDISIDRVGSLSKSKVLGAREFPQEFVNDTQSTSSTSSLTSSAFTVEENQKDQTYPTIRDKSKVKGSRPLPSEKFQAFKSSIL